MLKLFSLLIISSSLLLCSCSTISSSFHYTKGTECLARGDYTGAVNELEKAVELDPSMARNQNNLCCAYLNLNNYERAWYHARKAVQCPYKDGVGNKLFIQLCKIMIIDKGLSEKGTLLVKISENLGTADGIIPENEDGISYHQYGTFVFIFKDQKLDECGILSSD